MKTFDSKKKVLPAHEIIHRAARQQDLGGIPPEAAVLSVVEESKAPSFSSIQFGNTLFVGHRGNGDKQHIMEGRAFNVDTAANFVKNGVDYARELQKIGVTHYVTHFEYKPYLSYFKRIMHHIKRKSADSEMWIDEAETGEHIVYLVIGQDEIE